MVAAAETNAGAAVGVADRRAMVIIDDDHHHSLHTTMIVSTTASPAQLPAAVPHPASLLFPSLAKQKSSSPSSSQPGGDLEKVGRTSNLTAVTFGTNFGLPPNSPGRAPPSPASVSQSAVYDAITTQKPTPASSTAPTTPSLQSPFHRENGEIILKSVPASPLLDAAEKRPGASGDVEEGGIATAESTTAATMTPTLSTPTLSSPITTPLPTPRAWWSSSSSASSASSASSPRPTSPTPPTTATATATARTEAVAETEDDEAVKAVGVTTDPCISTTSVSAETTPADSVAGAQIVLPCAPSDKEKVMYYRTGRMFIVTCGIVASTCLAIGMWLFIMSSPYFLFYAVPTVFFTVYLAAHYLVVAIWGRDFDPRAHAEVLKKARDEGYWPTVDIFLPVCNESLRVLANTWDHVALLNYPHVKVHVLDDGAKDEVQNLAAQYGFKYVRRPNRPELKKAGNLRYAFSRTVGDVIVIFDADFCPRADFLRETVPYFLDPKIGILQTPQFFRWRKEQTWVEQGAGVTQEFFYRLVQVNQDVFHASCCAGSCALYRRETLAPLGGMAAVGHSEDLYTGFKVTELGYNLKYLPLPMAMGTCPDEARSFFMQQYRWCMGTTSLVSTKEFWGSTTTTMYKICVLNGMMYYIVSAAFLLLAPFPMLLLIWIDADEVLWIHSLFILPAIIFAAIVIPCWSKERYGMSCHRVKIIQCYAHLFAIWDHVCGTAAAWVPSGGGASRSSSKAYRSSVVLLVVWNILVTIVIVGGGIWRMTTHTWYHFVPTVVLGTISFCLNMSTLL